MTRGGAAADGGYSFPQRAAIAVALGAAALLLLALLVLGIDVLLAAFAGVLLAVLLNAGARFVERRTRLRYGYALTAVILLILVVLGTAAWLLVPQISEQVDELGDRLPAVMSDVEAFLQQYGWGRWLLDQAQGGDERAMDISALLGTLSTWSTYLLVVIFVGLFAAANPRLYRDGLVHLFPPRHQERAAEVLDATGTTLRWWLLGQAITMIIIGVSTTIVLLLFDIPLAIPLGIIVGLLGFIPYLGPIIGGIPIAMIAATQGAETLLWVMLGYVIVQTLEGYVAVPLVHQRTVYLPPVFTIVFQILLGFAVGLLGFVLATPLGAVLLVLHRWYRRDVVRDPAAEEKLAPR